MCLPGAERQTEVITLNACLLRRRHKKHFRSVWSYAMRGIYQLATKGSDLSYNACGNKQDPDVKTWEQFDQAAAGVRNWLRYGITRKMFNQGRFY